jgi:hypothetical protein
MPRNTFGGMRETSEFQRRGRWRANPGPTFRPAQLFALLTDKVIAPSIGCHKTHPLLYMFEFEFVLLLHKNSVAFRWPRGSTFAEHQIWLETWRIACAN